MNMKKVLLALVVTCFVGAQVSAFSDVPINYKYYDSIDLLYKDDVIAGYEDGTFKPYQKINRAEFTKILIHFLYPVEIEGFVPQSCFKDVTEDQWFSRDVCFAKGRGIIVGYEDGYFRPEKDINIVEALKITFEAYGAAGLMPPLTDPWYQKYVDYAKRGNLNSVNIWLDEWTDVGQMLTRGEMAELIMRSKAAHS